MALINEVFSTLSAFGSSDDIAAYLFEKGIRGELQNGESCPIANLFLIETDAFSCTATEEYISVVDDDGQLEMLTTPSIRKFIERFDDGVWPELETVNDPCDCSDCLSDYYNW